ncbi:MAG: SPFH/Band 7/PHB domain protein [Oligoflexia bacterium]|nr:SPFH/Band 7/PHB domain protein [Oligoflexia bacterium]
MSYFLLAVVGLTLVVLAKSIKIVPQKQVMIIERLGKYNKRADAGLNIIVPFLDSVRAIVDLREQISPIEPQSVISRDNVTMAVDAVMYYLVVDPVRATYEVQSLKWGIEQLTLSALRNVIGSLDLDHTLTSRDTINTQLRGALDVATQPWGVKILRVELKNINPPAEIKLTMEKQMTAERTRRALVTTAEGEKAAAILKAEGQRQSLVVSAQGEKEAAVLEAEGKAEALMRVAQAEANSIKAVAQAIGGTEPQQYLVAQKYLEALGKIGDTADKIVFLPFEAAGVMGALGGMKELFGQSSSLAHKTGHKKGSDLNV